MKVCPQCQELLVHTNLGGGVVDVYCEECGYPDENMPEPPKCTVCGARGVGVCGETWRCEDHWRSTNAKQVMGDSDG